MTLPRSALAALPLMIAMAAVASPVSAQERVTLGWGRLLTNDAIGDGEDRWRSGSYVLSWVRGPEWTGALPSQPGEILEFRLRAETIAPADLITPAVRDRRYVGALTLGVHTQFETRGIESSLGLDAVIIGPQTGISDIHGDLHDLLGLAAPTVFGAQLGNDVLPTVTAEFGRSFEIGPQAHLRPFVEMQAGAETLLRVGGDLTFGGFGGGALMMRDSTTGQRYRGTGISGADGFSLTMGADLAEVYDSQFFLSTDPITPKDSRARARVGLHWQGGQNEVFYGLTWLGEEFEEQPEGQVLGAINLRLRF